MSPQPRPSREAATAPRRTPGLVASDLDSTLLRHDHTLSSRTRATLDLLRTIGVPFVIVTGRAVGAWRPTARRLSLTCPAVCADGATIVDHRGQILVDWPIPPAVLRLALADLREAAPAAVVGAEAGGELLHDAGFHRAAGSLVRPTRVVNARQLAAHTVSKLLVRSRRPAPPRWRAATIEALGRHLDIVDSGVPGLVEAVASGVSKATGLAWVAKRLGVSQAEVVAFGDMPNDVPMLRWAGHGVAVAGAHPSVVAAADATTGSCAEDGVATYLERLLAQ